MWKKMNNSRLESVIGYKFQDPNALTLALSHRSMGKNNNERLEFLGDSLLNLIIAEALCLRFPEAKEGELTRVRSSLVKGDTLAEVAVDFNLGDYLVLGEGERKSGGFRRASILADAVEAIIGAIYLESGMDVCRDCVLAWFKSRLNDVSMKDSGKDSKTRLQEYLQEKRYPLPIYNVIETTGESHSAVFVVECVVGRGVKNTKARASSKRNAEKLAAQKVLDALGL